MITTMINTLEVQPGHIVSDGPGIMDCFDVKSDTLARATKPGVIKPWHVSR